MRRRAFLHGLGVAGGMLGIARRGRAATRPEDSGSALGTAAAGAVRRDKLPAAMLTKAGARLGLKVTRFTGSHRVGSAEVGFPSGGGPAGGARTKLELDDTIIECATKLSRARDRRDAVDVEVSFRVVTGRLPNASLAVTVAFDNWSRDAYVLVPGAVYGGNRFASRRVPFPPLPTEPSDIGPHVPPIISDIPRLNNQSGDSRIMLSAADTAAPVVGVRIGSGGAARVDGDRPRMVDPIVGEMPGAESGRGFLLLAEPTTALGTTSLELVESPDRSASTIALASPCVRPDFRYSLCNTRTPSTDRGADLDQGRAVTLRLRLLVFACPQVQTLFDRLFEARRDRLGPMKLQHELPLSAARRLVEERLLAEQWSESLGVFTTRSPTVLAGSGPLNPHFESMFRTGADGGLGLAVAALNPEDPLTRTRAAAALDFQLGGQGSSGLFHTAGNGSSWWDEGEPPVVAHGEARTPGRTDARTADGKGTRGRHWTHVGRSIEALYLGCRQLLFFQKADPAHSVPERWRTGLLRSADAIVRLWTRHQQLGQYVNCDTGDVVVGGSTAGALAPAALLMAARALGHEGYTKCATALAEHFYGRFVRAGIALGGAPAAMQAPDSRSAAGLLESFVALAEVTGAEPWFARAAEMAHQLATWTVAWDAVFPAESTLGRLGARTTGAVLVSAQDKWAQPGFAGLAGDALFRLYRATGRVAYLELLRETIHNTTGYVDPEDRRPDIDSKAGWVAGRIPIGDALGAPGEVQPWTSAGAAQASCLLAATDIPSIYVQPDTGFVFVFDHVDTKIKQRTGTRLVLSVSNPTRFECQLRIFAETSRDRTQPLGPFPLWGARSLSLSAGETEELEFSRTPPA